MSEPFIGEIRLVGFNFPPRGWALCEGQLLPINQNQALFSILGTTYGGDGRVDFALPDLRGRVPGHVGVDLRPGARVGVETVTLTAAELPNHGHAVLVTDQAGASTDPAGQHLAQTRTPHYATDGAGTTRPEGSVGAVGGNQPHENINPVTVLNFVIALQGIFPARQ